MPWGYVDERGAWAIEPAWDRAGRFSEGLAWVVRDAEVGFIDPSGQLAIPLGSPMPSPSAPEGKDPRALAGDRHPGEVAACRSAIPI